MSFLLSYIILAQIFAIAALSTNLLVGIIGIFSVSQAAIMGIGAYACALLLLNLDVPFFVALAGAMIICAGVNIVTSLPSLRLAGDYFVVSSFGVQLVATAVFINWAAVTGGSSGLSGIPAPTLFGMPAFDAPIFVGLSTFLLLLVSIAYALLMRSPYGRLLNAIRLDEIAVVAAGRNVLMAKLGASAVSGAFAGAAGSLYAVYMSFIDPISFEINVSVLILTMLVVGGARTLAGSIIGPFLLLAIPQLLALIQIPSTMVGPARQLAYGMLLVAFMLLRPQGIAGKSL
jgi:branched-chain amino acid transport system permease protein